MTSTARLGLLGVSLFVLLFPLTLGKPGLPTRLKADEAAYYGMAQSLAHDGDLTLSPRDVDRFFREFPYGPVNNLILMSADGWKSVHYGKPFVYSLFAAPFARVLGADGMLFFNALLLVAMIWMGWLYLRRYNDEGIAALFAAGFFLLSAAFAYVFWLQPEVFNMAAVMACLFFGLPRETEDEGPRPPRRELVLAAISGATLALAVANKPMLVIVGLAPLWAWWRARRWRPAAAWACAAAACLLLLAALSLAWTGTPTSYLGVQRGGFTLCGPGQMPALPGGGGEAATTAGAGTSPRGPVATAARGTRPDANLAAAPAAPAAPASRPADNGAAAAVAASPTGNSYRWLFRLPDTSPSELRDNVEYFLWGRHTGLLLYLPFAVLAVLLFLLHAHRSGTRWVLLGSLAAIALFFLLLIAWNWQGGGGFVGNRYYVNVYPAFLFLVTSLRPKVMVPIGYALAGLFLSPLLLSPLGTPGPEPTLQMHVRARPLRWFPLELTLRNVPGYQHVNLEDFRLLGRRDVFLPLGEEMWLQGATPVELYLLADHPLSRLVFQVTSDAADNRIDLDLAGWHQDLTLGEGERQRVELPLATPDRRWTIKTGTIYAYRLVVASRSGRPRLWERQYPPSACSGWPWQRTQQDSFYAGAELLFLGTGERLGADVFAAQWESAAVPAQAAAGATFTVPVTVVNRSRTTWPNRGGARVRLAYHWVDARGAILVREGERTDLLQALPPGKGAAVAQRVIAPPAPGRYVLVLEPVFETVAWFADRRPGSTFRAPVEVTPAALPLTPAGTAGSPPAVAGAPAPQPPVAAPSTTPRPSGGSGS